MIDPMLLGQWTTGASRISLEADDWWYSYDIVGFAVSADDQTLTQISGNGTVTIYARVGGGTGLYGVWALDFSEPAGQYREEITYSASGAWSTTWLLDNQLDNVHFGYCAIRGPYLHLRERRARVDTDGAGGIILDKPYLPDENGSYAFDNEGRLLLTLSGQTVMYTRI